LQESNTSASTGTKKNSSSDMKLEQGTNTELIETPNPTLILGSNISANVSTSIPERTPIEKLAASRSSLSDEQKRRLEQLDSDIKPKSTNTKFFKFTAQQAKRNVFFLTLIRSNMS
jgi:hypothetical protein